MHRDDEIAKELRFHVDERVTDLMAAGVRVEEARRQAQLEIGGLAQAKEAVRDGEKLSWLGDFGQDVRYAIRGLARERGFTAATMLLTALSIGFSCSAFAFLDAVVLRPLPVWEPERLVLVSGMANDRVSLPRGMYDILARERRDISHVFGFRSYGGLMATIGGTTSPVSAIGVTGDYFGGLGRVPLEIGGLFDPNNPEPVCLISYGLWQRAFGGRPDVVGQILQLGETPLTITGVAGPRFVGTQPDLSWDLMASAEVVNRARGLSTTEAKAVSLETVVRLSSGVSVEGYSARIASTWPSLVAATLPSKYTLDQWTRQVGSRGQVDSLRNGLSYALVLSPGLSRALQLTLGLALTVFGAGCLTLTSMVVARTTRSFRDLALKRSLGGTKWRVLRPVVVQYVLIAAVGGAGGLAVALAANSIGQTFLPAEWQVYVSWSVVMAAIAMAALIATITSAISCVLSFRISAPDVLRGAHGSTPWHIRLRAGVLTLQLALSIALACSAVAIAQDLSALARGDVGFDVENLRVFTLHGRLPQRGLQADYFDVLAAEVRSLPGVQSAGITGFAPALTFLRDLTEPIRTDDARNARASMVCTFPGIFSVWGVPLLSGRDLEIADRSKAIVTKTLAATLYPAGSPLSHRIRGRIDKDFEIIGVIGDMAMNGQRLGARPIVFVPCLDRQDPWPSTFVASLYVRSSRALTDVGRDVTRILDRRAVHYLAAMDDQAELRASSMRQERALTVVSSACGVLLAGITVVGLFAFCSYLLSMRHRDLAIRASVGATSRHLLFELTRELLVVIGAGAALGVVIAVVIPRTLANVIGPVGTVTVANAIGVIIVMIIITASALFLPARRVLGLDLALALRSD